MTDTMDAAIAEWILMPKIAVSIGTIKIPPAIPSVPPSALADKDAANNPKL
jgi:hypothetical protein